VSIGAGVSESQETRVASFAREHGWSLFVWGVTLTWSIALFALVREAYDTFQLPRYDLGNMVQAVWSTAHGRPLEMTEFWGDQVTRLGIHVDPILVLLTPFWVVAPHPLTLAAVQIAACALGALPVFWLAQRHLESKATAAVLALAYLAYPWLAWTALEAVHPVTFAIPLLLYALWFLDSGRIWAFASFAFLALTTGELVGLTVAGMGLWYAFARGRRASGIAIAVAGLAWTSLCLKVVVPAFSGSSSVYYERFTSVGGSPLGLAKTVVTDPGAVVTALATVDDLAYVVWLGLPLVGAFLLAPGLALVAGPQLLVNLLSDSSPTTDPRTHYIAAIVPVLVGASVLGLARLPAAHRRQAAVLVLMVCVVVSASVGQLLAVPGLKKLGYQAELPKQHVEALRDAVATVPEGVPVTTTNRVGGHLSARRYVYSVPVVRRAEWIVLDTWDPRVAAPRSTILEWDPEALERFAARIGRSPAWTKVFERDGVLVFRRTTTR
jgi:uncharacterized membrane protein